jgi:hypothetical protein
MFHLPRRYAMTTPEIEIVEVPEHHRFDIRLAGERVGLVTYRDDGGIRTFVHTEVQPDHEGQGLAGQLVGHALDETRTAGLRVVPECSYVSAFIERHPEYADLVAA